jgi:hypothetical protein
MGDKTPGVLKRPLVGTPTWMVVVVDRVSVHCHDLSVRNAITRDEPPFCCFLEFKGLNSFPQKMGLIFYTDVKDILKNHQARTNRGFFGEIDFSTSKKRSISFSGFQEVKGGSLCLLLPLTHFGPFWCSSEPEPTSGP